MVQPRHAAPARALLPLLAALCATACTLPPLEIATPMPSPLPTPVATPRPSATLPLAEPSATPDLGAVPVFGGGEIVTTTVPGLRVRDQPGLDRRVVTDLLPAPFDLSIVMGPIVVDDLGWYLVTDADPAPPDFEEGWVAAGFEPGANLRSTGRVDDRSPVVISLAQRGDAEFGPIEIPDEHHVIRWVTVDPERVSCRFAVSLAAGGGEPVPALRSPVGPDPIHGVLQSTFFIGQPGLRGQVFLATETDCAWALAVIRQEPEPPPSP